MTTAKLAYGKGSARIKVELAAIKDLLKAHGREAAKAPGDWGYVGDLGHIEYHLGEIRVWLDRSEV